MSKNIVFCDAQNKELDQDYANKLIEQFRKQTGWKVEKGTRIFDELTEFSKGYSKTKRDVREVSLIFAIASGICA